MQAWAVSGSDWISKRISGHVCWAVSDLSWMSGQKMKTVSELDVGVVTRLVEYEEYSRFMHGDHYIVPCRLFSVKKVTE